MAAQRNEYSTSQPCFFPACRALHQLHAKPVCNTHARLHFAHVRELWHLEPNIIALTGVICFTATANAGLFTCKYKLVFFLRLLPRGGLPRTAKHEAHKSKHQNNKYFTSTCSWQAQHPAAQTRTSFISCLLPSVPSSSPCEVANAINRAEVEEQYASQAKHCLRPRERLWRFYLLMNYPFFIGTTCFLDSVLLWSFSSQPPGDEGTIPLRLPTV